MSHACAKGVILLWVVLIFTPLPSCRRKKTDYLLRYRYRPGKVLRYDISLKGEGLVKVATESFEESLEEMEFPVLIAGDLILETTVKNVSERNVAELALAYQDLDFKITNRMKDRELVFVLNDRQMEMKEGDRVLNVEEFGGPGYPLNGIVGGVFTVEVDERGGVTRLEGPPGFTRSFPYLDFTGVLEQLQPDFPEEAIQVGESWSRDVDVSVPGLGMPWDKGVSWKMELLSQFRGFAEEKDGEVALIDYRGTLDQKKPADEPADSPFEVERAQHKLTGEFGFDLQSGQVLFNRISLDQEMDIRMGSDKTGRHGELNVHVNFQAEVDFELAASESQQIEDSR